MFFKKVSIFFNMLVHDYETNSAMLAAAVVMMHNNTNDRCCYHHRWPHCNTADPDDYDDHDDDDDIVVVVVDDRVVPLHDDRRNIDPNIDKIHDEDSIDMVMFLNDFYVF